MIEEILNKYQVVEDKYFDIGILYAILYDLGLTILKRESFTTAWFNRKRKKGLIILPEKSIRTDPWRLTGKQLRHIVEAFVPGGKGKYDYREDL